MSSENIINEQENEINNSKITITKPELQMLKIEAGLTVIIENLENSPQQNGQVGIITDVFEDNKYGIQIHHMEPQQSKTLKMATGKFRPRFNPEEIQESLKSSFEYKKPNIEAIIKLPSLVMTPWYCRYIYYNLIEQVAQKQQRIYQLQSKKPFNVINWFLIEEIINFISNILNNQESNDSVINKSIFDIIKTSFKFYDIVNNASKENIEQYFNGQCQKGYLIQLKKMTDEKQYKIVANRNYSDWRFNLYLSVQKICSQFWKNDLNESLKLEKYNQDICTDSIAKINQQKEDVENNVECQFLNGKIKDNIDLDEVQIQHVWKALDEYKIPSCAFE